MKYINILPGPSGFAHVHFVFRATDVKKSTNCKLFIIGTGR